MNKVVAAMEGLGVKVEDRCVHAVVFRVHSAENARSLFAQAPLQREHHRCSDQEDGEDLLQGQSDPLHIATCDNKIVASKFTTQRPLPVLCLLPTQICVV